MTKSGRDESGVTTTTLPEHYLVYRIRDKSWSSQGSCPLPLNYINSGGDDGVRFGDVNGDGLIDILQALSWSGGSANHIWINTGCGWATSTLIVPGGSFVNIITSPDTDMGGRVVDVNGDALVDVLWAYQGQTSHSYINNGNGWTEQSQWNVPSFIVSSASRQDAGVLFEDVNGDGLVIS